MDSHDLAILKMKGSALIRAQKEAMDHTHLSAKYYAVKNLGSMDEILCIKIIDIKETQNE